MYAAVFVGLISFPFVYFTIRRLRLLTTAAFIFGVVLAEIVVITPFDRRFGLGGSVPALALALCVVSLSGWRLFHWSAIGQSSSGYIPSADHNSRVRGLYCRL